MGGWEEHARRVLFRRDSEYAPLRMAHLPNSRHGYTVRVHRKWKTWMRGKPCRFVVTYPKDACYNDAKMTEKWI